MPLECKLVERTSSKGTKYYIYQIKLTDSYTTDVFVSKADLEIIKLISKTK